MPVTNFPERVRKIPENRQFSTASYLRAIDHQSLDISIFSDFMKYDAVDRILNRIRRNPKSVRFRDLLKVCDHYFGQPRQRGGSHRVYRTPWQGDPRINIQNEKGMAKAYQVKQVLAAIDKMEAESEPEH